MTLYGKIVKELGHIMNIPNEVDIYFVSLWASRRKDGSLNLTAYTANDEEEITDELREKFSIVLKNLAETVYPTKKILNDEDEGDREEEYEREDDRKDQNPLFF